MIKLIRLHKVVVLHCTHLITRTCIQYLHLVVMIHFSEEYILYMYFPKQRYFLDSVFMLRYYENAALQSQVLYCKHYMYMYLDEYLSKL